MHAILDAGRPEQIFRLTRDLAGARATHDSTYLNDNEAAVFGATVAIVAPNGLAMIAHADTVKGQYRLALADYGATLVPGEQYRLDIHTLQGETITGTTTIPMATPVTTSSPVEQFNMRTDTLRLAWPRVAGARSYEVRIQRDVAFDTSTYSVFADSTLRIAGLAESITNGDRIFAFDPRFGVHNDVMVAAVDSNYYDYYRIFNDPFLGAPPSRLAGAVGVFGSMVSIVRRTLNVVY